MCKICLAENEHRTGKVIPSDRRKPHRCPVCGGNGKVDNGFYNQTTGNWASTSTAFETCRSCGGTGIVWSY